MGKNLQPKERWKGKQKGKLRWPRKEGNGIVKETNFRVGTA